MHVGPPERHKGKLVPHYYQLSGEQFAPDGNSEIDPEEKLVQGI